MMQDKGTRYFQFPVSLLRELFTNKEQTLNKIIHYGIYHYSKSIHIDEEIDWEKGDSTDMDNVCRQLMYDYYRAKNKLTHYLLMTLEGYINSNELYIDEDYNGFHGDTFRPEMEIECLFNIFVKDSEFKEKAIEYYRIHASLNFLNIDGNIGINSERKFDNIVKGDPMPMVNKKLVFEYRDNEKTEFDLAQFAAYIGIRSILGKKSYCKTNKQHIVARMFGYAAYKLIPEKLNPVIKELMNKYSNRYWIDKVLLYLQCDWNILIYDTHTRGLYIGIGNKISIDTLALAAETKKKKHKIESLKQQKKTAKERALQQLNKVAQLN